MSHKISEDKYVNVELLQFLYLWDDLNSLFSALGWQCYVDIRLPKYKKLVWEFYTSFSIDETEDYKIYIHFWLGSVTHEIKLIHFGELLLLSVGDEPFIVRRNHSRSDFCKTNTCDALVYVPWSFKATFIYKPILQYL